MAILETLASALRDGNWVLVGLVVNFLVVRLLKDDTRFPTIPVRLRPWLSVALGGVETGLELVLAGTSWKDAALHGAVAGFGPILAHVLGVESLAGDRDLPLPKFMKAKGGDDDARPPSGGAGRAVGAAGFVLGLFQAASFAVVLFCCACVLMLFGCAPAAQAETCTPSATADARRGAIGAEYLARLDLECADYDAAAKCPAYAVIRADYLRKRSEFAECEK